MNAQVLRERGLTELPARLEAAWLAEAERALASNASTVAVLPMRDILRPDGYLAGLRASGYVRGGALRRYGDPCLVRRMRSAFQLTSCSSL